MSHNPLSSLCVCLSTQLAVCVSFYITYLPFTFSSLTGSTVFQQCVTSHTNYLSEMYMWVTAERKCLEFLCSRFRISGIECNDQPSIGLNI